MDDLNGMNAQASPVEPNEPNLDKVDELDDELSDIDDILREMNGTKDEIAGPEVPAQTGAESTEDNPVNDTDDLNVDEELDDELADIDDILKDMNADNAVDEQDEDAEQNIALEPVVQEEPDSYDAWTVNHIKQKASFVTRLLAVLLVCACAGMGYLLYERCKLAKTPLPLEPVEQVTAIPEEPETEVVVSTPEEQTTPYFIKAKLLNEDTKLTETLVLLSSFKTIQAPWWSSGSACVQMVLDYWGRGEGQDFRTLTKLIPDHNTQHAGLCLDQIVAAFKAVGGFEIESTQDYQTNKKSIDLAFLKRHIDEEIPVIVGWNGSGAHWQVLIGYDEMSTENEDDDVLIMANPFDTNAPVEDGLGIYEAKSFIENFVFHDFNGDPSFEKERCFVAVKPIEQAN